MNEMYLETNYPEIISSWENLQFIFLTQNKDGHSFFKWHPITPSVRKNQTPLVSAPKGGKIQLKLFPTESKQMQNFRI